jgi:membrane protease YdiL (CAAX protease family)
LDYVLGWLAEDLAGRTFAVLFAALFASWLTLRIFEGIPVREIGLWWSRNSMDNLALGLAGGAGAACLALTPPLLTGAARIVFHHSPDYSTFVFALVCVAAGSIGEELLFRGYGFQLLVANLGPWAAILPVGVIFGLLHAANPGASQHPLGVINTVGFGILFGYAYLRSRDLWLPIGLHVGWNVVLPLFGADLSGFRIFTEASGHELAWRAGALWSGGNYGPEASLLTSAALIPLAVYLWKAPIRRQRSPFTDEPVVDPPREPAPPLRS